MGSSDTVQGPWKGREFHTHAYFALRYDHRGSGWFAFLVFISYSFARPGSHFVFSRYQWACDDSTLSSLSVLLPYLLEHLLFSDSLLSIRLPQQALYLFLNILNPLHLSCMDDNPYLLFFSSLHLSHSLHTFLQFISCEFDFARYGLDFLHSVPFEGRPLVPLGLLWFDSFTGCAIWIGVDVIPVALVRKCF